jgi:serine/threonine protein kinase
MSPEQARGEKSIDHRADVYGLAAVAYELVSGRRPHPGDSHNAILHHIATQPAVPLDFVEPALPEAFVSSIGRALSSAPAARFESAEALAGALAPFAKRRIWPAPERPPSSPYNDAISPTELAPTAADRAEEPTRSLAGSRPKTPRRRPPKPALFALAAGATFVLVLLAREPREPVAPAPSATSAPPVALPRAARVNPAEAPLPVTIHTEPLPAPSVEPPRETARLRAPAARSAKAEARPAPVLTPEPARSAPSLAFDRRNPYD